MSLTVGMGMRTGVEMRLCEGMGIANGLCLERAADGGKYEAVRKRVFEDGDRVAHAVVVKDDDARGWGGD